MTDLTSASPVDINWHDDETSMPDEVQWNREACWFAWVGAGIMACFPIGFCVAAARAMDWF